MCPLWASRQINMKKRALVRVILICALCVPHFFAAQTAIRLVYPNGLALDFQGNLYISDIGTHRILKLDREHRLSVIAGTGESGFAGDGGSALSAALNSPHDIAFDRDGNLLIADTFNHRIRRIDAVIGKTDADGWKVVDYGWWANRSIYMEDIACTIYSALGIDWTKTIENTPSGRAFHYVEPASGTECVGFKPVQELYA